MCSTTLSRLDAVTENDRNLAGGLRFRDRHSPYMTRSNQRSIAWRQCSSAEQNRQNARHRLIAGEDPIGRELTFSPPRPIANRSISCQGKRLERLASPLLACRESILLE
jgi:hypothetical protein